MFKKATLRNNIPLVMETAQEMHSVCLGIWVKVGSRFEEPVINGISHFLEHMFFKGTEQRSAEGIAMEIDSLGGELNAFTSTEYTLYYVKVLDEYLDRAVELLTDIFLNSTFPENDIEKEKGIINEEISMVEDTPSDFVFELFANNIWGDNALGQTVLGKRETIGAFKRDDLINHVNNYYGTENIIISCSGKFDEDKLINRLNEGIGSLKRNSIKKDVFVPGYSGGLKVLTKDLSEAHICIGLKGMPYSSDDRYTMHLLNTILGSGFSSRLFQNVREKKGLVYSIYSYHVSYIDTGIWSVYAGTDKKHVSEVINISVDEVMNLAGSVTEDELQRAKAQLKGNLILALESTSNKMTNIAKQEIYYGKYFTPDEIIKMVEDVTIDDLRALSNRIVGESPIAVTVYGPVTESDLKNSCKFLQ
jgi:predicted Zn-dependent peptidase